MRSREIVLLEIRAAVQDERRSLIRVLELLREVERDRHSLEMGYPTLFEFATKELGYSAGAAQRRIESMRLLKTLPALEKKIETGSLSLCVAARTQSVFRKEERIRKMEKKAPLALEAKREIAQSVIGLSTRECERKLVEIFPETAGARPEKTRALSEGKTLIQFTADAALMEKLEKLKGLLAHQNFEGSYHRLFEILADLALKKLDPLVQGGKSRKVRMNAKDGVCPGQGGFPTLKTSAVNASGRGASIASNSTRSRYIPVPVKRAVWNRDSSQCTFVDSETGKRCMSRHGLQYDHITPFAWGGETSFRNLRLRCPAHNAFTAGLQGLLLPIPGRWC